MGVGEHTWIRGIFTEGTTITGTARPRLLGASGGRILSLRDEGARGTGRFALVLFTGEETGPGKALLLTLEKQHRAEDGESLFGENLGAGWIQGRGGEKDLLLGAVSRRSWWGKKASGPVRRSSPLASDSKHENGE